MAQRAIGSARVTAARRLSVRAVRIIFCLSGVAGSAGRLGNSSRVRILVVALMTGGAGDGRVRALGKLLRLVVTGGAIRREGAAGGGANEAEECQQESGRMQARYISKPVRQSPLL
jgi:hypothetical protein